MAFFLFPRKVPNSRKQAVFILYTKETMETMIVKINGADKDVIFQKVFTRKIDREYNEILFKNLNASLVQGDKKEISINPTDIQYAQDYLISAMTNLSPEEVDMLAMEDYQKVLDAVNAIKNPPHQSQAS